MAKVEGRRPDETAEDVSWSTGPEQWGLIIAMVLAIALVGAILAYAGGVGL